MCGFSGIVSKKQYQPSLMVHSLEAIKHRGPDDSRLLFTDTVGNVSFASLPFSNHATINRFTSAQQPASAFFGFNRLSIVDLSDNGMQPFYDDARQTVFLLNGEVYNYKELRDKYLSNEKFVSNSDSEVAFKLYLQMGDGFVHHLRGMFAIVVYDRASETLKVWRDPMGIKPFFYSWVNDTFLFSSEMKGILAMGETSTQISDQGLAYSMYLGTCPAPLTIYRDIQSLQAGHHLVYHKKQNHLSIDSYWQLKYHPEEKKIKSEEFAEDVRSICQLYQTGDVAKGLMLSGGMDSGTMAYYMGQTQASVTCFNIFADDHHSDERHFAALNAQNAGLDIKFFEVPSSPDNDFVNRYLHSEEEPNTSPEPTLFLCDKANKLGIKVLYNALGPDEVFGGYRYYRLIDQYGKLPLLRYFPLGLVPAKIRPKFAEIKRFGWGAYPIIARQFFAWDDIERYFNESGREVPQHPVQYLLDQVHMLYPQFVDLPKLKQASYLDIFYFIASHHSFRSDQPSMLNAIEMRFPFLDHLFVQKYFNQSQLFDGLQQQLKPLFNRFAANVLPAEVLGMPKKGFTMPTERWLEQININTPSFFNTTPERKWYGSMLHSTNRE